MTATSVPQLETTPITQVENPVETAPGFGSTLLRPVSIIAGVAMLATPLLITAGLMSSPPQASREQADYIEALARDPWLTSVSASLLHYGWITMALGLVVAMTLVRGRRGRVLTLIGGVVGGFVTVQMSALMMNDYVLSALGNNLPMGDAVRVADALMKNGDVLSTFVWQCATLALIFPVFTYLGLARAKIISWWITPLSLFPMILPFVVMGLFGNGNLIDVNVPSLIAGSITSLVCYLPTFWVGLRLLQQGRRSNV